ncbi:MAG: hypothetical protein ISS71_05780 [Phycisphaerae bacterium]|nr:hypothetical protein [Phycisphaerae bacterium]
MKRKNILVTTVIIVVLCICFVIVPIINKEVHKTQLHSAYESLNTSLMIQLSSYYIDTGRYPESLNELTEIEYCDGATPEMLKDFKYVSNGNSCELSYFSDYYKKESKLYMVEGELKWEADNEDKD